MTIHALATTSPAYERCDALHVPDSNRIIGRNQPYVITWTGQAEGVRRWHPGCVPAMGLVDRWLDLPAGFVDTVRLEVRQ